MSDSRATCWVITDGAAGNERQALALADALGTAARVWRIPARLPWRWFGPRFTLLARAALPPSARPQFVAPWPAIAIGCGRGGALFTRALRRWSGGATFTVQILDPRIPARHFDVVVAPSHDRLDAPNVIAPLGSLNPVDDDWLAQGAAAFGDLAELPAPRTTVLIGASHRAVAVDTEYCIGLLEQLTTLHERRGGSFLVSTSRRTPAVTRQFLRSAFARFPGRYWGGPDDGPNPYAGFLAHADRIVVTPDSVNMLSEACAVGVPVHTWLPRPARGKLALFHAELIARGHLRQIGQPAAATAPKPLRETMAVAQSIRRAWQAHREGVPLS